MKNWKTDLVFHFFIFETHFQPQAAPLGQPGAQNPAPRDSWRPTIEKMKNWKNEKLKNVSHFSICLFLEPIFQAQAASLGQPGAQNPAPGDPREPTNWKNEKLKKWKIEKRNPFFNFSFLKPIFQALAAPLGQPGAKHPGPGDPCGAQQLKKSKK